MQTETKTNQPARNINKPGYIVFLLAGIYFMIRKDFSQAATFWCLALVFDPFDIKIAFKERPVYQQLWLYVHCAIALALLVLTLLGK